MSVLRILDEKLAELAEAKSKHDEIYKRMEAEINEVRRKYAPDLLVARTRIDTLDKEIRSILRKDKIKIFGENEHVDLKHGVVYWRRGFWVKRVRGALQKLKELGWTEAIKVTESVRWDVIEEWPDERLRQLGTERVIKESLEYELK